MLAAEATRNSLVDTDPTIFRGSVRPEMSIVGVATGPQPPPPVASMNPATRPSGARKRLREAEVLATGALALEGESDEQQGAEGEQHTGGPGGGRFGGDAWSAPTRR